MIANLDGELRKAAERIGVVDDLGLMVLATEASREALAAGYDADTALDLALGVLRASQGSAVAALVAV